MKKIALYTGALCTLLFASQDSAYVIDTVPLTGTVEVTDEQVSMNARGVDLHTGLALLAENNGFTLRADTVLTGTIDIDIEGKKLPEALNIILDEKGLSWRFEKEVLVIEGSQANGIGSARGRLLEVRGDDSYRIFSINYPRVARKGQGASSASISSSSSGEAGKIVLTTEDEINFWDELDEQLKAILGDEADVAINRMSGTVYISGASAGLLNRAQSFIEIAIPNALQQVEITARIYEVTLTDDKSIGIDWKNVNASAAFGDNNFNSAGGNFSTDVINPAFSASNVMNLGLGLTAAGGSVDMIMSAVQEQGDVQIVSQPQVVTMNNQPAMVKIGTDLPYFSVTKQIDAETGREDISEEVSIVTVGVILSVTPQISNDGWITLGIEPVISDLRGEKVSNYGSTAPEIDIKQSASIVRVKAGETVKISGLIKNKEYVKERAVPLLSRIPILGNLFRWENEYEERKELVIFLTPTLK